MVQPFFYSGYVDDRTVFKFETGTEVYASCAATLNDEFWVIGGYNRRRQVILKNLSVIETCNFRILFQLSKIQDCKLTKVGRLDFDYVYGGCNTFSFGILLCFSDNSPRTCHS